jgi:hypothetical protein
MVFLLTFNYNHNYNNFSVPPEWIVKPQDQAAVEGQDVVFQCRVAGIPLPTVTWRKLDKSKTILVQFLEVELPHSM